MGTEMKLETFPEANKTFGADQPQYIALPAYKEPGSNNGRIVFCWSLSWRERLRVLFSGRIWHQVYTFHHPLQPQLLTVEKPDCGPAPAPKANVPPIA